VTHLSKITSVALCSALTLAEACLSPENILVYCRPIFNPTNNNTEFTSIIQANSMTED